MRNYKGSVMLNKRYLRNEKTEVPSHLTDMNPLK